MQKLFRSLIAIGGLAGLAACGDDVTVAPPPDPAFAISGAPVTAIQVGARVQLSANAVATWATSNAAVATVDGTGLVTAVAAGTASITATKTSDVNQRATVTITVTAPAVRGVTVSPAAVTLNPGQTQGFVANVDADAGVARTVTWTSSNTAVATVTAAGVVTAVAPGAATITATSTASTTVSGAASVTVRTPTAPRVSIQKITVGGNLNNPVNLAATAGQVDVTIDVDPGDFIAQRVELLVDGVVVASQSFTAAQSRDLTNSHSMPEVVEDVASTVLSFNTAAFDPVTGAVLPINLNGAHVFSARLFTVGGGSTGGTATLSPSLSVTFANANSFISTIAYTGTTASATSPAGLLFRRGGMDVTVRPIIYNPGQTVVALGSSVSFGAPPFFAALCDASGNGTRTAPLTGTNPFVASFPQTVPTGVNILQTVAQYEFDSTNPACLAANPFGEFPFLTAVDNLGNTILAAVAPAVTSQPVRLDNRAPARGGAVTTTATCNVFGDRPGTGATLCETGVPVLNFHTITGAAGYTSPAGTGPNGRTGGWINAVVGTNATVNIAPGGTTGADNLICNNTTAAVSGNCPGTATSGEAPSDAGVGGVTFQFKAAATTSVTTAAAAAAITTPQPLGESVTDVTFCGVAYSVDALGNTSATNPTSSTSTTCSTLLGIAAGAATPAGSNIMRFGDDFTAPVAAWDATSLAANARVNTATLAGNFVLAVNDPGSPLSASGIQGARWLIARKGSGGTSNLNGGGGTTTATAPTGTAAPACGGGLCATGIAAMSLAGPTASPPGASTVAGASYLSARAVVRDAAGNDSPEITRDVVGDNTVAVVVGPSVPASIGGSFSASGAASDNLDLRDFWISTGYCGGACAGAFAYIAPNNIQVQLPQPINTFPPVPATLQNSNVALTTTVNAPLILQSTTGAGVPNAYAAAAGNALSSATVNVRDQTQAAYVASTQGIGFPSIIAPTSGVSTTNFTSFITTASNTSLCAVAAATAGCVVGTPAGTNFSSTVLQARALGVTSVFNNPFSRVDFFCNSGAGQLLLIGSSSSPVLNDNGAIRTFDFQATVSAATLFSTCGGVAGGGPGASITPPIFAFGYNTGATVALVAQPIATVTINP